MADLSGIVEKESLSLKEKIGKGLTYLTSLSLIPYVYNWFIARPLGNQEILPQVDPYAGNVPHILVAYYGGRVLESILSNEKITNVVIGIATTYHVAGEIFHSEIAPNLPQIMPGTPDVNDIPLTLTIGLGLYLANKKI